MSNAGADDGRRNFSGLSDDGSDVAGKGNSCPESCTMLPKALTVSPTDLFPEEQFESSDSEDDAELHAFTQRLDADWRSNLSQALSWNAFSSGAVTSTSDADAQARDHQQEGTAADVGSSDGCRLTDDAMDKLCQDVGGKVSLSTGSTTDNVRQNDLQPPLKSGASNLSWSVGPMSRFGVPYGGCSATDPRHYNVQ